jgi:hypothetical protein
MLIPVSGDGQMTFVQYTRASASAMWIAPIVEALEEKLKMEHSRKESPADDKSVERLAAMATVTR